MIGPDAGRCSRVISTGDTSNIAANSCNTIGMDFKFTSPHGADIRLIFYGHQNGREPMTAKGWFRRELGSPKRRRRRLKILKAIDTLIEEMQVDHVMKSTEGPFY
jgi:hypothetical protein